MTTLVFLSIWCKKEIKHRVIHDTMNPYPRLRTLTRPSKSLYSCFDPVKLDLSFLFLITKVVTLIVPGGGVEGYSPLTSVYSPNHSSPFPKRHLKLKVAEGRPDRTAESPTKRGPTPVPRREGEGCVAKDSSLSPTSE